MEFVVLAIFCGLSAAVIGKLKGSSFWIWFLVRAVLPLLGTLAAIFYRSSTASRGVPAPNAGRRSRSTCRSAPAAGAILNGRMSNSGQVDCFVPVSRKEQELSCEPSTPS